MPWKAGDPRHKVIGGRHRALSRYHMIANRLKNTHLPRNKGYKGIELRVSKKDFVAWFMANDFAGCSVDRIDPNGHYELSNMQLIPLAKNIAKDKVLLNADGTRPCYVCKVDKPLTEFVRDSRRKMLGVTSICLECERRRK